MKKQFNSQITAIGEIPFFRLMSKLFNTSSSRSIFVDEVHSHNGFIEFYSKYANKPKKVEIADLLLVTFNKSNKEIRICFLQAKFRPRKWRKFLSFKADLYQWELLSKRPYIRSPDWRKFPSNILNFNPLYKSITSYGVFYYDRSGQIDFLYTIPENIKNRNLTKTQTMDFNAPLCNCPNINCKNGKCSHETISTCSMDLFATEVLACRIGAPILPCIKTQFVVPLLKELNNTANEDHKGIISDIQKYFDLDTNDNIDFNIENIPNVMIVVTSAENYKTPKYE